MQGGYDAGYSKCPCFWGREPGSLIKIIETFVPNFVGLSVLDVGCGEGKNAVYFANRGAIVTAIDISNIAIENGRSAFTSSDSINWICSDIRNIDVASNSFDIVISYGLFHCFSNINEIEHVINKLKNATKEGAYHIVCAFNDRSQDLSAHPEFSPCLLTHQQYMDLYADYNIVYLTDTDLVETHPHNNITHSHSMTRLIARRG